MKIKFLAKTLTAAAVIAASMFTLFIACLEHPVGPPESNRVVGPKVQYTVTYNVNGGSGSTPSSQSVNAGNSVTLSSGSGLTRSGFAFGGWNTNSSGTGTNYTAGSSFTPSSNITLFARWYAAGSNTFTITFNANGGSVTPTTGTTGTNGRLSSLPTPSRSGHIFSGWFTSSTGGTAVTTNTVFNSNTTIFAQWTSTNITYGSFTDSRDSQSYRTIVIGTQTWMADNLNFVTSDSWCYGNNTSNCNTYGRLYTWSAAMGLSSSCNSSLCASQVQSRHRGVCPVGWHIPSDAEWTALTNFVGSNAGTKLKSQTGWNTGSGSIPGTDAFGFSALPGGGRFTDGSFDNAGNWGDWWSATENDAGDARGRYMGWGSSLVNSGWDGKGYGFSVRCLRD